MAETLSLAKAPSHAGPIVASARNTPAPQNSEVTLVVGNMRCGGCIRAVESALLALQGVSQARVNLSTRRVTITARCGAADAETCVEALRRAGFTAFPLATTSPTHKTAGDVSYLPRVAVAGFAAANIMLLSVSVWSGGEADMPASLKTLFHWLSALIALPAVAYAGQPFFASARQALAARRLNMDVPISLGVILAVKPQLAAPGTPGRIGWTVLGLFALLLLNVVPFVGWIVAALIFMAGLSAAASAVLERFRTVDAS